MKYILNIKIVISSLFLFLSTGYISAQLYSNFEYGDSFGKSNQELSIAYQRVNFANRGRTANLYSVSYGLGLSNTIDISFSYQRFTSRALSKLGAFAVSPKFRIKRTKISITPALVAVIGETAQISLNPVAAYDIKLVEGFDLTLGSGRFMQASELSEGYNYFFIGANLGSDQKNMVLRPRINITSAQTGNGTDFTFGAELALKI